MVLLNGSIWLQALRDLRKVGDVVWGHAFLLVRCVTGYNGHPFAETEMFRLSNFANLMTSIVRSDAASVAVVKIVMNFSAAFNKVNGVFGLLQGL